MKTVIGLFDNLSDAHEVVEDLMDAGFTRDDISLVARDRGAEYATYLDEDADEEVAEATATGAIAGGAIGGIAGLLVGLGALAIPGVGPVVAAGPIVAALTGAGIGAATGGIFGALVGWGIPEAEAGVYAEGVRRGGTLVIVRAPDDRVERAVDIMEDHDPVDVETRASSWRQAGWTGYDPEAAPYTAEQIDRERVRYGDYDRQSDVDYGEYDEYDEYDFETFDPIFREHYETTYANRGYPYARYEPAYRYGFILATDERYFDRDWAEIEPVARRHWESEHEGAWEEFKDTVRHAWEEVTEVFEGDEDYDYDEEYDEEYDYDEEAYDPFEPSFRQHYETHYRVSDYSYDQYQPAYRYGYDLATDYRFRDLTWEEVEPEARRRWEEVNEGTWEDFKESIHHGWNEVKRTVS
ncbi:MAG TPA: hypothetical protein VF177_17335 [Anaerolineae bacterium]